MGNFIGGCGPFGISGVAGIRVEGVETSAKGKVHADCPFVGCSIKAPDGWDVGVAARLTRLHDRVNEVYRRYAAELAKGERCVCVYEKLNDLYGGD